MTTDATADTRPHDTPPLGYLRQLAGGHVPVLIAAVISSITAAGLTVLQPRYLQQVVNRATSGGDFGRQLLILVLLIVAATVASALQSYLSLRGAEAVAHDLRMRVSRRFVDMTVREADTRNTADLLSRVAVDTVIVKQLIAAGILPLLGSSLMLIGITVVMLMIDPWLFGLSALAFVAGFAIVFIVAGAAHSASGRIQECTGAFSVSVERALGSLRAVKAFNAQEREVDNIRGRSSELRVAGVGLARLAAFVQPVLNLCIQGGLISVILVGSHRLASGAIDIGSLLSYIMYMFMLIVPIAALGQAYTQLQIGFGALQRCREVENFESEAILDRGSEGVVEGRERSGDEEGTDLTVRSTGSAPFVEFRDVHFTYCDGPAVLQGLDLTIQRGDKVTLAGRSGSGKSTMLELLEGFYAPARGSILIDGVPLDSHDLRGHRSRIAMVPQEASVMTGSLRENLTMGTSRELDDVALTRALRRVGLDALATRGPEGLDADLGQGGVTLSSGQRQRIAWARVLLSEADLILMDEPDSNLDAATRALVADLLADLAQRSTVIVVSHRLDSLRSGERVVVLDSGVIVADGVHEELLEQSSDYRAMRSSVVPAA